MTGDEQSDFTILDHKDRIIVPGSPFKKPANEYVLLLELRDGLEFLNSIVEQYESGLGGLCTPSEGLKLKDVGRPVLRSFMTTKIPAEIPRGLVTCAFHWYSVSACQYVRTIGTIAYQQGEKRSEPDKYVEEVIPAVKVFRDKIGAHTAWSMNSRRDNEAERLASVFPQLAIHDNTFIVSVFHVSMTSGGKRSDSYKLKSWSVTRIHKMLRGRYWPSSPNCIHRDATSMV
jgi:hypothetical protein